MLKKTLDIFSDSIKERTKSPLISSTLFFWLIVNKKLVFKMCSKYVTHDQLIVYYDSLSWQQLYFFPLFLGFLFIIFFPKLEILIQNFRYSDILEAKNDKIDHEIKAAVKRNELKEVEIKGKIIESQYEEKIKHLEHEEERINSKRRLVDQERDNLHNEMEKYQTDKNNYKTKIQELEKDNNILKGYAKLIEVGDTILLKDKKKIKVTGYLSGHAYLGINTKGEQERINIEDINELKKNKRPSINENPFWTGDPDQIFMAGDSKSEKKNHGKSFEIDSYSIEDNNLIVTFINKGDYAREIKIYLPDNTYYIEDLETEKLTSSYEIAINRPDSYIEEIKITYLDADAEEIVEWFRLELEFHGPSLAHGYNLNLIPIVQPTIETK